MKLRPNGKHWNHGVRPENNFGISPQLFNFIYVIVVGYVPQQADDMKVDEFGDPAMPHECKVDLWDWEPGVMFFRDMIYWGPLG